MTTPEDEVDTIQRDNPGWRIWRSMSGDITGRYWCASLHDPTAGVTPTLVEDSPHALRTQLANEARKAKRGERWTNNMAPSW